MLNKIPNSVRPKAKSDLHEIRSIDSREDANKAFDHFMEKYETKYQKACECMRKDRDVLLAIYEFPAEQWSHLRTTNPIESTFATIRLRHKCTSLAMVFKLAPSVEKKWKRLRGYQQINHAVEGRSIKDGFQQEFNTV